MPVAVDGRRRLQPEERKRLLLTNAVEVFARRGIGRGGHTEIAEIGGVSVATVFNYFKTREALVEAVLEEVESFLLNLAEAVYAEEDNPLEAIRLHVKAFLNACEESLESVFRFSDIASPAASSLAFETLSPDESFSNELRRFLV